MEDICIPKQREMLIPVRLTRHKNISDAGDGFCGTALTGVQRRRLAVAHSISRNKTGVTMAQVMNPNPTAVKIHKGKRLENFRLLMSTSVCV